MARVRGTQRNLLTEAVDPMAFPAVAEIGDDEYGRVMVHALHRRSCSGQPQRVGPLEDKGEASLD